MPTRSWSLMLLNLFVLLFGVSAVLGMLPSYDPALSQGALLAIVASVGLYFGFAYLLRYFSITRPLASILVLGGWVFTLYFITQFGYQNYPETPASIQRLGQLTTLLPNFNLGALHPNAAATLLEALLPLGIALAFASRQTVLRFMWLIGALVMGYAVVLTVSRGSWVALGATTILAVVLALLSHLSSRTRLIVIVAALLVLVGGLLVVALLGPNRLPFLASTLATANERLTLYRNSFYLARDYLFTGVGLGDTFAMVYSRYSLLIFVPFLTYAHNLLLAVWLGQGLLGLVALLGLTITFYAFVYRVLRSAKPDALFHGAWLGVTALLIHGLTDARQYIESPWTMPVWFLLMSFTVALGWRALFENEPMYEVSLGWKLRPIWLIPGVTILAVGLLYLFFQRPLQAAWYTNLGALDETRAELTPNLSDERRAQLRNLAQTYYEQALTLAPDQASANRRLGNLRVELGDYAAAVPLLETAYTQETANPAAIKGLGLAYVWVGRTEEAAAALNHLNNSADARNELYTWGQYRTEQKQPLLAAYAWETADIMSSQSAGSTPNMNLWLTIAGGYREAGQPDAARRWYTRILAVDPENQQAHDGLVASRGG